MKKITFKPVLTAVAAAVALSACTMMPKYEQPQVAVPIRLNTTPLTTVSVPLNWVGKITLPIPAFTA